MDIILYTNVSPPNTVNKKNKNGQKISDKNQGTLVENVRFIEDGSLDMLNPSLLLQLTNDIEDVVKYNYVKIPKYDRFYYIDKVSTEGGLIRLDCRVDVLMSHKKDILRSSQYVLRQEKKYHNGYLYDELLPITSQHNYKFITFGDDVDNRSNARIILATTGQGGRVI
jgi:hypothetical protein